MSLVTDIQTIVNTLYPSATFKFMSEFHGNLQSHDMTNVSFPLIILDNTLRKRKQIHTNANLTSSTRLVMYFLTKHSDKSNIHQTDTEMNTLVENMEQIADEVFIQIYRLEKVRFGQNEIAEYDIDPEFKFMSSVLSGVKAQASWKENQIRNWCLTDQE